MPRFIISRLSALGDVVCSLPAASALKRAFPDAEITWIVDPRFAGVVRCCTVVDHVIVATAKQPPTFDADFDAALDLQGLIKSAFVLKNVRAKERLGYHWQRELASFFTQAVLPDPTSVHVVDQYVDVARAAGGEADRAEFNLMPPPDATASVLSKGATGDYVVLNAGAGWVTKRWTSEGFAAVSDRLAERGLTPIFIGHGKADQASFDAISTLCAKPPMSLVSQTSVEELIAVIAGARAHVGGDTGSTHIAAALGKPAIALMSLTRPERCCPYGQFHNTLFEPLGLNRISPDQVWNKLEAVL